MKRSSLTDISPDANALTQKVAGWIVQYIDSVLKKQDRFTIALSGGSTPQQLYSLLASESFKDQIEWSKMHFFWGDERYVPFEDERNNAHMAFETLLNHVPVNPGQIHIMRTDIDAERSAVEYEKILHSYFDNTEFSFDLALLGMGDNAHTLSLFPGYDNIYEREKWVMAFYLAQQDMQRITLTAPIVNKSAQVAFLVTGAAKAEPLYHVLYGEHDPDLYPAQLIQPYHEKPWWFVDEAAARELPK